MTACLHLVQQGAWELAIFVYAAATLSFSMANTFYDSLLSDVAPPNGRTLFQVWGTVWGTLVEESSLASTSMLWSIPTPSGLPVPLRPCAGHLSASAYGGLHSPHPFFSLSGRTNLRPSRAAGTPLPAAIDGSERPLLKYVNSPRRFIFSLPIGCISTVSIRLFAWRLTTACLWGSAMKACSPRC